MNDPIVNGAELVGIGFFLLVFIAAAQNEKRRKKAWKDAQQFDHDSIYGDDGFAHDKECKRAKLFSRSGARIGYSLECGKELRYRGDEGHITVSGETGCLKTSGVTFPNVIGRRDSSKLIMDTKSSEITLVAGKYLARLGGCYAWAAYRLGGATPPGVKIVRINLMAKLLDPMTPADHHRALARVLAEGCIDSEEASHNRYFSDGARELLADMIVGIAKWGNTEEKTLPGVILAMKGDFGALCDRLARKANREWAAIFRGYSQEHQSDRKGFAEIIGTVFSQTSFLTDPAISRSLSGDEFRFEWLGERRCTLLVCIPLEFVKESAKLCRLMAAASLGSLLSPNRKRNRLIELFFEECASYGYLEQLLTAYATSRAFRIRIWSFWTSLADMEGIYGIRHRTILGNSAVQLFMGGSRDPKTAEYISRLAGQKDVVTQGRSVSTDMRGWPQVNDQRGLGNREVLTVRDIRDIPPGEALMIVRGVRGIIRCKFVPYFKQLRWFFRYQSNPLYRDR